MRIPPRLRGWPDSEPAKSAGNECLHGVLNPKWNDAKDMGKEHRIVAYRCQSCRQEFDPDEATWLWLRAIDRLRDRGTVSQN
jgi:hypothetical protein